MKAILSMSLTEMPQYRRLVAFVREVEEWAEVSEDEVLSALVENLEGDLLEMAST